MDPYIKTVDLRKALGIAAATFHGILKKQNISPVKIANKKGSYILGGDSRAVLERRGLSFPKKAEVICFGISKGGVGKTTCSFFTALRMADYGAKVLLVDADAQGNLTQSFTEEQLGTELNEDLPILSDIIPRKDALDVEEAIIDITDNISLIPSTPLNSGMESAISRGEVSSRDPSQMFNPVFTKKIKKRFDYIIIDSAPAINLVNSSIYLQADRIVMPVCPDKYSVISLQQTLEEVDRLQKDFKKWKPKTNILFTKYDARERASLKILSSIVESYEKQLMRTLVRNSVQVRSSVLEEKNIFRLKSTAPMEDFDLLARELMGMASINRKMFN